MSTAKARRRETASRLETEIALLTRTIDHISRRSDLYGDMERSWYIIAHSLESGGDMTINDLAARLLLDGTTVTRQVSAMARAGIVERNVGSEDARTRVVSLSAHGRDLMHRVQRERIIRYQAALADWTDSELQTVAALVAKFNHSVNAGSERLPYLAVASDHRQPVPSRSATPIPRRGGATAS